MHYYVDVLKKYADFSGRARRAEYWMFVLFNIIVSIILGIIAYVINTNILVDLYTLAIIVPGLAVAARRLHDTDRSGWWLLIVLIPFIGSIILIVFVCLDSQPGENKYGPNPKGVNASTYTAPMPPTPPVTPPTV